MKAGFRVKGRGYREEKYKPKKQTAGAIPAVLFSQPLNP
jgi:hypothetical protein